MLDAHSRTCTGGLFEIAPGGPERICAARQLLRSPGHPVVVAHRDPTTGHPSRDRESVLDRRPRTTHRRCNVLVQDPVRLRRPEPAAAQRQRRGRQLRVRGRGQSDQGSSLHVVVWRSSALRRRRRLSHLRQPDVRLQAHIEDEAVERREFGSPKSAGQADRQLFRCAKVSAVPAVPDETSQQLPSTAPVLFSGRASRFQFLHHPEERGPDDRPEATHAVARRTNIRVGTAAVNR